MRTPIAVTVLAALTLAQGATAQTVAGIPRTPDGKPDLQGAWFSGYMAPLERPDGFDTLIIPPAEKDAAIAKMVEWFSEGEVYDPEADSNPIPPALLEIDGMLRSSQLVEPADGQLPLTSLARGVMDADWPEFDQHEDRPAPERCLGGLAQAPMVSTHLAIPLQIVQTPAAFVFAAEDFNPARIIAMTGSLPSDVMRSPDGYSRGRWEGDTLIVETTHFAAPSPPGGLIWRSAAPVTADSKVVERFRMQSADSVLYQFTIEDPSLYKGPWLAEFVLSRVDMGFFEYACHEGNHSIVNILTAARLGRQDDSD
jgi:hypothetical protein